MENTSRTNESRRNRTRADCLDYDQTRGPIGAPVRRHGPLFERCTFARALAIIFTRYRFLASKSRLGPSVRSGIRGFRISRNLFFTGDESTTPSPAVTYQVYPSRNYNGARVR